MFFRNRESKEERQYKDTQYQYQDLQSQYVDFCLNPLRTREVVEQEFDQLLHTEGLKTIAFHSKNIMMLGVEEIIIEHPRTLRWHRIGEFTIFVIRMRFERQWYVDFRFNNTTRHIASSRKNLLAGVYYMHPHILVATHDLLDVPNGTLCIQNGGYQIHQHIRRGEVHLAAPLLIDILNTYDREYPFHHLGNWPRLGGIKR